MRLIRLLVSGATMAVAGTALARVPAIGGAARKFPDARGKVMIFTDQLPDQLTPAQRRFVASHYVGTQKMTRNWALHIRRLNPNFIILHYQLALGNDRADFVTGNRWTNDFARVRKHKNWFLHTPAGRTIRQKVWRFRVANILFKNGAPVSGYPRYWIKSAVHRMRENLDDGVFADSYTQDILMDQTVPRFPWFDNVRACEKYWLPQLNQFGAYVAAALHKKPEHFYYLPNLGGLVTSWDHTTNLAVGDGGMNEGFCINGPDSQLDHADWRLQMRRLLRLARLKKIIICQSYLAAHKVNQRWFVAGAYLLIKGDTTYLNMFFKSSLEWYPQYDVPLGRFSHGPRENVKKYWKPAWHVYRRRFANGMVLVNPGQHAAHIGPLTGRWFLAVAHGGGAVTAAGKAPGHLTYRPVSAVTIPAYSARVLLREVTDQ